MSDRDENLQNTMKSIYLRGVHKANVPISKFRNALVDEDLEETDGVDDGTEEFSVLAANAGKGIAEQLVDPVFQGWRRELRVTGYIQGWRTKYCHKKYDDCKKSEDF